jgi:hypothetical protein
MALPHRNKAAKPIPAAQKRNLNFNRRDRRGPRVISFNNLKTKILSSIFSPFSLPFNGVTNSSEKKLELVIASAAKQSDFRASKNL